MLGRGPRRGGRALSLLIAVALQACPILGRAEPPDPKGESDVLFYEGNVLMTQGNLPAACAKFELSLTLIRRGGTLLNLALCHEARGNLATALPLFVEAIAAAEHDGHADRQELARQHLDDLRSKLSWINVTPSPATGIPDLEITYDGAVLPREEWGSPIPADPGVHRVTAKAPGYAPIETSVTVNGAGETHDLPIPLLPMPRPTPPVPEARVEATPVTSRAPAPPSPDALTHRAQFGVVARVDVDPIHPGVRVAAGLTYGLGDRFEVGASALIGRDIAVEPQLTFFVLDRPAWKPLLNVGIPIFFRSGVDAGVRGAAGVQCDVSRHFGFFGQVGGAYFPGATPGYARGVFLPSLGAQGRI